MAISTKTDDDSKITFLVLLTMYHPIKCRRPIIVDALTIADAYQTALAKAGEWASTVELNLEAFILDSEMIAPKAKEIAEAWFKQGQIHPTADRDDFEIAWDEFGAIPEGNS